MKKGVLVIFSFFILLPSIAQDIKSLSKEQQLIDLDVLVDSLEYFHPNLYHYQPKERFDYLVDSIKGSFSQNVSHTEFYHTLSGFVSTIGDGHLLISPIFYPLSNKDMTNPLYRFRYYMSNGKLYIVEGHDSLQYFVGQEIVSINGIKSDSIINYINSGSVGYEGSNKAYQEYTLNINNLIPYFISKYFQIYDTVNFELSDKGAVTNLVLNQGGDDEKKWFPYDEAYTQKTEISRDEIVGREMVLHSAGLNSFTFKNNLHDYFKSIKLDSLKYFVLDLRGN